ncbi:PaaI family thioesterase [Pseudarthrobacter oxydans]|uniref:PaaI family thioesterase n=1 Tax=Pseudarthrobacter oxydans TaxID=1671 RepID=UPI003D29F316
MARQSRPIVPDHTVHLLTESEVLADVTFCEFHHGSRGAVHGGAVALIFDEVLGQISVQGESKRSRTASLTVDYRALTPMNLPLQLHGRLERRDGRKVFLKGTLRSGSQVLAEASALFVTLQPWQETDR